MIMVVSVSVCAESSAGLHAGGGRSHCIRLALLLYSLSKSRTDSLRAKNIAVRGIRTLQIANLFSKIARKYFFN